LKPQKCIPRSTADEVRFTQSCAPATLRRSWTGTPRTPGRDRSPAIFSNQRVQHGPSDPGPAFLRGSSPATSFCQESPKRPSGARPSMAFRRPRRKKATRDRSPPHVDGRSSRSSVANKGRLSFLAQKEEKEIRTQLTGSAPVSDRREKVRRIGPIHQISSRYHA
jgi:hypothetical protein